MGLLRHRREGAAGTTYRMREKMFSIGDDYWIETESGERAIKVNGKALRIRDTLVLEDRDGRELVRIQEKKLRVRDTMEIERGRRSVATAKKALVGIGDRFSIAVQGGDDLDVKGNVLDHETSSSATARRSPRSPSAGCVPVTRTGSRSRPARTTR